MNSNIFGSTIKPNTNTNLFGPKIRTEYKYESIWFKNKKNKYEFEYNWFKNKNHIRIRKLKQNTNLNILQIRIHSVQKEKKIYLVQK